MGSESLASIVQMAGTVALVLLTGALVLVTGAYVWLTHKLVLEARETRRASLASQLVVEIEPQGVLLNLVIRNVGRSPATDISISYNPPLLGHEGVELPSASNMAGLGPGQQRVFLIDVSFRYFGAGRPPVYRASARWADAISGLHSQQFVLDVESFRGTLLQSDENDKTVKELHSIGSELKEIHRQLPDLRDWSAGDGRPVYIGLLGSLAAIAAAIEERKDERTAKGKRRKRALKARTPRSQPQSIRPEPAENHVSDDFRDEMTDK
jgi:hypothetical protein